MRKKYALVDKVVWITGAAGGIGAASAKALYDAGAFLVLTDLTQISVEALADRFDDRRVLVQSLDVTDADQTRNVVSNAIARFGRVDVAIANAAISWPGDPTTLSACDEAEFEKIVEVDFLGVWRTVKAALPEVLRNRGQVVVTSSIYAFINGMVNAPYAASKAAVESLGRSLRSELAGTGASASVLYPGWTSTPMAEVAFGGHPVATELLNTIMPAPARRVVPPEAVARALVAGLACRAPRIIVPTRWRPVSLIRGMLMIVTDEYIDRSAAIHRLVRKIDLLDGDAHARAGDVTLASIPESVK
ncbi:MAG: SDR family NAD(P)-dependent oxidoreductase [Pseudomonadota bacterium]